MTDIEKEAVKICTVMAHYHQEPYCQQSIWSASFYFIIYKQGDAVMRKSDSTEDRNLLRWIDSIENDDADYLDDWFNLASQQDYDEALINTNYSIYKETSNA